MKSIYLASSNAHKAEEIAAVLDNRAVRLPSDDGIVFEPLENGSSFAENSFIKARALWELVQSPTLADDSGLCVDALDGAPGIFSARFGCENGKISAGEQNALLLRLMRGKRERSCRFICAMTLFFNPNEFYIVQRSLEGTLSEEAAGEEGFGYDPLVFIPALGKTVAQLTAEQKNSLSHRGKACRAVNALLKAL